MEDDAAQARLVRKCLERAGYEVDIARDGATGLTMCEATPYAAVVVDQTMPSLNGLEVLRVMTTRQPLPPTIMVTGTGDEQIAVEAMKLGASDYLVKDSEGGFISMLPLVVHRSIEQRRTLLEKQQMEQELAQAQKMKAIGQLAAGIAHEINTPTQYIGDNARFLQNAFHDISNLLDAYDHLLKAVQNDAVTDNVLREVSERLHDADLGYLNAEIPLAIRQSLEGVEHVASIVGAMKEFSHPGTEQKQAVDLNHVIEGAIVLCRNEWKYVARLDTDFDAELPQVYCLSSDINRVIVNLVINAAHAIAEASPHGDDFRRAITIRTRRDGDWAEIRVEDTGCGIPEEIHGRVFEPFFTTKDVGQGTGQGLSIVHAIVVEKHGGTVHFETKMNEGTTFIVRLPIDGRTEAERNADLENAALSLEMAASY
jgi:signal transduction histidine kinase